jgi:ClpX C4-type zinc finger protein
MPDTNFDIGVSTVLRGFESSRLYKALLQGAIATKRIAAKVMICHSQGPECWHVEFADQRAHVSAMADDNLKCSFCGKRASEVERLIAGTPASRFLAQITSGANTKLPI